MEREINLDACRLSAGESTYDKKMKIVLQFRELCIVALCFSIFVLLPKVLVSTLSACASTHRVSGVAAHTYLHM